MTIARLMQQAAAAPADNTYKLSKLEFDSLGLRGTTYPFLELDAETYGDLVCADGGTTVYTSKDRVISKYVTSQAYNYNLAVNDIVAREFRPGINMEGTSYLKSGGSTLYIAGGPSEYIVQYDLDTPYEVSSYTATSLAVSNEGSDPWGVWFKPDGTKMFVVFNGTQNIVEYSLTTAWDISTATPTGSELDFSADTSVQDCSGLYIRPDGSSIYMFQYGHVASNLSVFEYNLSTAFDLSTASSSYDSLNNVSGNLWRSGTFKSDGTAFYTGYYYGNQIREYPLSTAWDLSTASAYSTYTLVSVDNQNYGHITWSPDGLGMVKISGLFADRAFVFRTLSGTPFDASSLATSTPYFGLDQGSATRISNFTLGNNGTRLFVSDSNRDLYQYNLSTANDLSTATYSGSSLALSASIPIDGQNFVFSGTGSELLVLAGPNVDRYTLSTAWDLSTAVYEDQYTLTGGQTRNRMEFTPDGSKIYLIGNTQLDTLYIYPLSTNWDISTAGTPTVIEAPFKRPAYFQIFDSGSSLVVGTGGQALIYEVPASGDLTSCKCNGRLSHNRGVSDGYNSSLEYNSSGSAFYTYDFGGTILKYSLSEPYDVSTASLDSSVSGITGTDGSVISVSKDETHVLVSTSYRDYVAHYELSTPGDLSTITLVGNYTFNDCRHARFSTDGSYFYVVANNFNVYAQPLSTPFDISTAGTSYVIGGSGTITTYFSLEKDDTVLLASGYSDYKLAEYTGSDSNWSQRATARALAADTLPKDQSNSMYGHAWNGDGSEFTQFYLNTFSPLGYSAVTYSITT